MVRIISVSTGSAQGPVALKKEGTMRNRIGILIILAITALILVMTSVMSRQETRPAASSKSLQAAPRVQSPGARPSTTVSHRGTEAKSINTTFAQKNQRLIKSLESDDYADCQTAQQELIALGDDGVADLIAALARSTVAAKGIIIFILGRIQDYRALPAIIPYTEDANAYIRRNAVEALGVIRDSAATASLVRALSDTDSAVRARSAWALSQIGGPGAGEELIKTLKSEDDARVKRSLVRALGILGEDKATKVLLDELAADTSLDYKEEVVAALGSINDQSAVLELEAYAAKLRKTLAEQEISPAAVGIANAAVYQTLASVEGVLMQLKGGY